MGQELTDTRLSQAPSALGESPVWDAAAGCLWWIDGVAGLIHRSRPEEQGTQSWEIGGHVGAIALADDADLVVTRDHDFLLFTAASGETQVLHHLADASPAMRLNDAKLDRQGRLVCAGMGRNADPIGALHVLAGHEHRQVSGGISIGNGVCFSPEGDILYYSDTLRKKAYACDYDPVTGTISGARLHIDTAPFETGIDGATIDAEGRMWASFIHTAEIACIAPDGRLVERIPAPVDLPSSVAFGGPQMATLFVTSIRDSGTGRAVSKHPEGGHVFAIDGLGVTGLEEARFKANLGGDPAPIRRRSDFE